MSKGNKWSFLSDLSGKDYIPWDEEYQFGDFYEDVPRRVHINTPWFHLGIAATPDSKYHSLKHKRGKWIDYRRR